MLHPFEHKGYFWLPEEPDNSKAGTLKYVPLEGLSLELMGSFQSINDCILGQMLRPSIILGQSTDGKKITLYDTFGTGHQVVFSGQAVSSFVANYAFVGKHFSQAEQISFCSVWSNFSYLEEWLSLNPFEVAESQEGSECSAKYKYPDKCEVDVPSLDCSIVIGSRFQARQDVLRSVNLEHKAFIGITPKKHKSLKWFQRVLSDLQNFLTLTIGRPVQPKILTGFGEKREIPAVRTVPGEIEIYYILPRVEMVDRIHPCRMIIRFPELKGRFGEYLNYWFEKAELLRPVYDLYFGTFYNQSMYISSRFLSLAQALEVFHRRAIGGRYMSDEAFGIAYNTLVRAIPNSSSEDFRKSLKNRLRFANEFSLRRKLRDLVDRVWDDCLCHFLGDRVQFIDTVVNTRNYLTHYATELQEKAIRGVELHGLNERLRLILLTLLLTEIGMELDHIGELIRNQSSFKHLKVAEG